MIHVLLFCCLALPLTGQILEFSPEGDCGIHTLRPARVSHFVETAAISRKAPKYPPALRAAGAGGKVYIRILVNRSGQVERTCPEFVKGGAHPERGLLIVAEAAALEWKFKPNFGFDAARGTRNGILNYIEGTISFDFVP